MKKTITIIQIIIFVVIGVNAKVEPGSEKGIVKAVDDFYKKTRFIMTKVERNIFKHLPDDNARIKFIKEFWDKRDPTPDNFRNEAKEVYDERIAFANRWFSEGKGKDTGWNTERGRILLQLGIPDRREWGEMDYLSSGRLSQQGRLLTTKRLPMERWFYYRFQLYLIFTDTKGFGDFRLVRIPAQLLSAVDMAKMSILDSSKSDLKYQLKFKPSVKKNNILIKIPTKRVSFQEIDNKMEARFSIVVYVYKNFLKFDEIKAERVLKDMNESFLIKKNIILKVPIKYDQKGKYYFDIIVEDKVAQSKYRDVIKFKVR